MRERKKRESEEEIEQTVKRERHERAKKRDKDDMTHSDKVNQHQSEAWPHGHE